MNPGLSESIPQVKSVIEQAAREGRGSLFDDEALKILAMLQLPTVRYRMCESKSQALVAASELGFPVVLKVASARVLHKSDIGGVAVGIRSSDELAAKYDELLGRARSVLDPASILGVVVQETGHGIELAVGVLRDPQFGPVLMFGLGGVLVELINDVSYRLLPITLSEARQQIIEIKGSRLLNGFRGLPATNVDVLAKFLVHVGEIFIRLPEIIEADFNPVFARGEELRIVDARMLIGLQQSRLDLVTPGDPGFVAARAV